MFEQMQSWWMAVSPEVKTGLQQGGIILAALLGGHIIGSIVARILRNRNFDAVLRLPGSPETDSERSFSPTFVAGMLVRLSIWATAGWWMAQQYGRQDIASTIGVIIKNTWALAAVLTATLTIAGLLASRIIHCLGGHPTAKSSDGGNATGVGNIAGVAGAVAYCLVLLVALLVVADMFQWPLTRNAALVLWQFGEYVLVAGAALAIGCLGASWARQLVNDHGKMTPERRAGQYTALAIMAASTILAVIVLLSSAGLLLALVALVVVTVLLWLVRGYLPDVLAGMQLRAHSVRQASFDGTIWQVTEVGFLNTQLCLNGQVCHVQNRQVLQSRMQEEHHENNVQHTPMEHYANQGSGEVYLDRMPVPEHDEEDAGVGNWR